MKSINFAKMEHIDLISDFEKDYFFDEAYSKNTLLDIMKDNYILKNNTNIFTMLDDNELIGYIIFCITSDFTDIYKIFVRDSDRRHNCGSSLIDKLYEMSKRYNSKKIMVEVREKNTNAIKFYEKNNFKCISKRENYYKNPSDNALIYERIIEY